MYLLCVDDEDDYCVVDVSKHEHEYQWVWLSTGNDEPSWATDDPDLVYSIMSYPEEVIIFRLVSLSDCPLELVKQVKALLLLDAVPRYCDNEGREIYEHAHGDSYLLELTDSALKEIDMYKEACDA